MTSTVRLEEKPQQNASAAPLISLDRIMVATDFSPVADRALDYAVSLARRFNSQIYLTHVLAYQSHEALEPNLGGYTTPKPWQIAEDKAKALVDSGRVAGVPNVVIIEEGNLWPELERLIEKHHIDLLVVGTHGISGTLKVMIGSSAEQIFRQARIPVLTVGPGVTQESPFETEFRSILFATNFGPGAEREAAFAFAIAQEHRAKLMFLHVAPFKAGLPQLDAIEERELVTRQLKELLPGSDKLQCKTEIHISYGEPVLEILRIAGETKADLIVIGATKGGSFSGHLPSTKAYGVVRDAKCPVLTIKS